MACTNRLIIATVFTTLLLAGCEMGGDSAGPCSSGFAVRFAITSVKEGLPLDSLHLRISLGEGGDPQEFQVNLKTGKSTAVIEARQGDSYTLTFDLFSAGRRIGGGEEQGRLACNLDVNLNPEWNDSAIVEARKRLDQGSLLPSRLTDLYDQALAGHPYELTLDSSDSLIYRWVLRLGDSTILDGDGARVRFDMPDSLAGRTVAIRLIAMSSRNSVFLEERRWNIRVIGARSEDRLVRMLILPDSAATVGSSIRFGYADGRIVLMQGYDALDPGANDPTAWAESLFHDGGRLVRTATRQSDGSRVDTLLSYHDDGSLAAVEIHSDRDTVVDSLFHSGGRLAESRRYVSGELRERAVYGWSGAAYREDSVFTLGEKGLELTRIIKNRYRGDSLIERAVRVGRGNPMPYRREIITYNGFGARVLREVYSEEDSPKLEWTEKYRYDEGGRRMSLSARDEVTGEAAGFVRYEYASASMAKVAKVAASMPAGAPKSAALAPIVPHPESPALAEVRFAHDGWRLPPPQIHGDRP